jgi:hypothetical protein
MLNEPPKLLTRFVTSVEANDVTENERSNCNQYDDNDNFHLLTSFPD